MALFPLSDASTAALIFTGIGLWALMRTLDSASASVLILNAAPWLRRAVWRYWYEAMARHYAPELFVFMNYGVVDVHAPALPAGLVRTTDATCAALYAAVAARAGLRGARVLEVGCGRGGGAALLTRLHAPASYVGVDFSPAAVALAARAHAGVERLAFEAGDAERLRFAPASFDAIVNVESSHCYGDVPAFFAEVARVLVPGGRFAFADFRGTEDIAKLEQQLRATPSLQLIEAVNITPAVVRAMDVDDARKKSLISAHVSRIFQSLFAEFSGVADGKIATAFRDGSMTYKRYLLVKK